MRVLLTSDWHHDWSTAGYPRAADIEAATWETVEAARAHGCSLYLNLGDLANPDPRSHRAVAHALTIASTLWFEHRIPSRWLAGNHDVIEDGSGTSSLSAFQGVSRALAEGVRAFERPAVERVGPSLDLVALPFTPRSHGYDPEEYVRNVVADAPTVLVVGHLCVPGIGEGSETVDMPRGRSVLFPRRACVERFSKQRLLMANGHYHEQQVFDGIAIPGSLERLTFGEERNRPGFMILEIDDA